MSTGFSDQHSPVGFTSQTLVDGARFHGCRPWVIPLCEPPKLGRDGENRTPVTGATIQRLSQSANPAVKICSCWLDSVQHEPAYKTGAVVCRPRQRTSSWSGDSNADHGPTRPALFPLSYTGTNFGGGRENCTPDDLLCRQMPCCLATPAST